MRTNVNIDDALIAQVMRAVGAKTKRQAIDTSLRETLRLHQQEALMQLWGLGWEGDLDDMRTSKYVPTEE